ncbi:MAG: DUF2723 domain-containing protein [Sedimentisphaerales bacterium]|nr:DUF2723 domain-containing protein [Sedimentisphaerales bacterium]
MEARFSLVGKYVGVLAVAGMLYSVSCAPGALWQDSGLIQYRAWHNDIEGFLGLAISHPLYYIVAIGAKLVPLGEVAYRVNLVSAFAAAVAVANLYLLVRVWLDVDLPAVVAAGTLALSHTFWQHASVAETYTLWTALFLAELIVLLQYTRTARVSYLYLLGLLNGLAIAVHMLASLAFVCYAVFIVILLARRAIRAKDVAIVAGLWILGALPYEYLIVKNVIHSGDILGTLASAAFADRWQGDVLNTRLSWQIARENVLFFVLNFPTPNALLFFVGGYALYRIDHTRAFRNVLVALLVLFFVFASRYTVSDRYAFFVPFYSIAAIVIGVGAHEVYARVHHRAVPYAIASCTMLPILVYAAAPAMAERMNVHIGTRGDLAYRDDYEFFLKPWKTGYTGADRFATEALMSTEPGAIILADTTTVGPLLYVQEVKGVRPDVKVVTGIISSRGARPYDPRTLEQSAGTRPVYTTSQRPGYCPSFVLDRCELTKTGVLWRVRQRQG